MKRRVGEEREREVEKREKAERRGGRMSMSALYYSDGGLCRYQTSKDVRFNNNACTVRFNATTQGMKRVNKTQLIAQWLRKRKEKLKLDAA